MPQNHARLGLAWVDDIDDDLVKFIVELDDLCGEFLTALSRENAHHTKFGFVQPLWEFFVRHFANQLSRLDIENKSGLITLGRRSWNNLPV